MISEEPGVSNSEICSTASCGMSMRSSAVLALSDNATDDVVSTVCLDALLPLVQLYRFSKPPPSASPPPLRRIDYRFSAGGDIDYYPAVAKDVIGLQPELIVTQTTPITAALQRETR